MRSAPSELALARHYLEINHPQRALEVLREQGGSFVNTAEYWLIMGLALQELERFEEAGQAARRGLIHDPESIPLLALSGQCEGLLNNLAAAERAFLLALRQEPENPWLLCQYALLLARAGQLPKARALVAEAHALDPDKEAVMEAKMILAYLEGNDREAERLSRELLAVNPENLFGHGMLGATLSTMGRVGPAEASFRRAAQLDPSDRETVELARESRLHAHWLMWPLRPLYRVGNVIFWLATIPTLLLLQLLGWYRAAIILILFYLIYCLYSWVVPPLLKWWMKRSAPPL